MNYLPTVLRTLIAILIIQKVLFEAGMTTALVTLIGAIFLEIHLTGKMLEKRDRDKEVDHLIDEMHDREDD